MESRLEVATSVIEVSRENFLRASSRIKDADIAQEAAELTRLSILQNAAAAVMASANIQPQLALQLLG